MYSFLSTRSGACLAKQGQEGFDSALWTVARKEGANEATHVLFLFENKMSEQDDKRLTGTEIRNKVRLIKKLLDGYNYWVKNSSPNSPELKEENVIVIFPVLRVVPQNVKDLEWGGIVMALDRDFLIGHFYKSISPFFQALSVAGDNFHALTVLQLTTLCREQGIAHDRKATKTDLVDLLYRNKSEAQLKEICKSKGVDAAGDKDDLIRRLNPGKVVPEVDEDFIPSEDSSQD